MTTYDGLLISEAPLSIAQSSPPSGRKRRRMSVQAFDSTGSPYIKHHSYKLQAFESVAGRTIRDLPFSHPRQLAAILPVCVICIPGN